MKDPRETPLLKLLLLVLGAIVLWISNIYALAHMAADWSVRGTIGDSFGAINSLFSGLGLAGIVYAILLQREDLAAQRYEISLARQGQSEALRVNREQTEALRLSAELSATASLLSYYLQERETARARDHNVIVEKVDQKIRRLSIVMENKLASRPLAQGELQVTSSERTL